VLFDFPHYMGLLEKKCDQAGHEIGKTVTNGVIDRSPSNLYTIKVRWNKCKRKWIRNEAECRGVEIVQRC